MNIKARSYKNFCAVIGAKILKPRSRSNTEKTFGMVFHIFTKVWQPTGTLIGMAAFFHLKIY